jgi:hypothetical protein
LTARSLTSAKKCVCVLWFAFFVLLMCDSWLWASCDCVCGAIGGLLERDCFRCIDWRSFGDSVGPEGRDAQRHCRWRDFGSHRRRWLVD